MSEFFKILSVFFASSILFGKAGVPGAVALYDFDFLKILVVCMSGGIAGNIAFTYLSSAIFKAVHNHRVKRNLIHSKRIFTSFNRRIIMIKKKFGLTGIAFISPMFLSTPLGAFIAGRFYRDKKKIIIYFTISDLFWNVTLYFVIMFFHDSIKGWLI